LLCQTGLGHLACPRPFISYSMLPLCPDAVEFVVTNAAYSREVEFERKPTAAAATAFLDMPEVQPRPTWAGHQPGWNSFDLSQAWGTEPWQEPQVTLKVGLPTHGLVRCGC
jgi:hypothetical protein